MKIPELMLTKCVAFAPQCAGALWVEVAGRHDARARGAHHNIVVTGSRWFDNKAE
jgi:hypothetical protein